MKVTVDVKNAQATEETRGSDLVAEGMIEVHTAHATTTHFECAYINLHARTKLRNLKVK